MDANEQITLNADLYDNILTERGGDYTAKPRYKVTLRNSDIARMIVKERTEYRQETIENILNLADQKKVEAIALGHSLVDGVGQFLINIRGSFEGEKASFDSNVHSFGISYSPGTEMQKAYKRIKVDISGLAPLGPVINSVIDSTTKAVSETLTSAGPVVIYGSNIKVAGEDPAVGIELVASGGGTAKKVAVVILNQPSQVSCMLPTLADGQYTLRITTQYGAGGRLVKEPRSYSYPVLLTVGSGGGDDENPDIL